MGYENGTVLRVALVTRGRRTGVDHQVMLRAVIYDGRIYLSRHRPDSDWFRNAMADPEVRVIIDHTIYEGVATLVEDEALAVLISRLKYPGEDRAAEKRVVVGITPYGQL